MGLIDKFKGKQGARDIPSEEQTLREILRVHGPIKARQIATMLVNDHGIDVERCDINSLLYRMKARGVTQKDADHCWTLTGVGKSLKARKDAGEEAPIACPDIIYTEEQKKIIEFDPSGNLLIRGQAGSGKTTVLAARAGRLLSVTGKGSLLFLTYNSALCSYVRKTFRDSNLSSQIKVSTFHDWAKKTAAELGVSFNQWADQRWRSSALKDLLDEELTSHPNHRLLQLSQDQSLLNWWNDEITWLFGQGVFRVDEYLMAERVGRGKAIKLSTDDRKLVWRVFDAYLASLRQDNLEDYENAGMLVIRGLKAAGELPNNLRYDHVLVDEVQDFHQSWLMSLAPFPRVSLTLAGDLAQKIYKRNFTWKSVGIDIHATRSRKLPGSHRTTSQIMEVAMYLIENSDVATYEDYVPPVMPSKSGPKVGLIRQSGPMLAWKQGCEFVAQNFKRIRTTSVAVAVPFQKQAFGVEKGLKSMGITPLVARGAKLGQVDRGITLTTFHQLKGLEFDHIVLMGLDDKNFPGRFLEHIPEHEMTDEEQVLRRLIYVAMTRAKESLVLVGNDPFCRFFENVPEDLFEQF